MLKSLKMAALAFGASLSLAACAVISTPAPPPSEAKVARAMEHLAWYNKTGEMKGGWKQLNTREIHDLLVGYTFATKTIAGPKANPTYQVAANQGAYSQLPSGGGYSGRWIIKKNNGNPVICMGVKLWGCRIVISDGRDAAMVMWMNKGTQMVVEVIGERIRTQ